MGCIVKAEFRVSKASFWLDLHRKGVSFLVRSCKGQAIFDELTVEVGKPDETSDFFEVFGYRPRGNGFNFGRVHTDFTRTDNQSEILNFDLFEFTFLELKVQIVLFETTEDLVDNLAVLFKVREPD